MSEFISCYLWWVVLGLLLGFLLFWLYDKLFRRDGEDALAEKDRRLEALRTELERSQNELSKANAQLGPAQQAGDQISSAAKFGFSPFKNGEDNLTIVEGIGPKISSILKTKNIKTFTALAQARVEDLQAILDAAGPSFKLAKPGSWPKQAQMCVDNEWEKLKHYQDHLVNGVEFDD